ncbi:DUF2018 family protein [Helicobacter sp. MIT 21-1697]|uniref:DUF2018 family protein n=1 Tax=Helicobacter sp. MIT 21-1697 TaxID=2993733 RepID=UPI00224A4BD0|nr:DUF2018 family protein [Helicobacter sp. MIT 21-1697]MCX2716726.1 DUF2018 family protein [Helicobacter sp. MIT 21-1697]
MDAFFEGTPLQKWQEIILNASPTLVGLELEALLERIAVYEALLEHQGVDIESAFAHYRFDEAHKEELRVAKDNLAIESMAKILGNYE